MSAANNLGLKLVALLLALICWFFVLGEVRKMLPEKKGEIYTKQMSRIITKQVPIQIVLEGEPAEGFRVERGKILVNPSVCIVAGERSFLEEVSYIRTMPINVSGRSKSFNDTVKLEPISKEMAGADVAVEVIVPIEKAVRK